MKNTITPFVVAVIKKDNKYLLTKRFDLDQEDPREFQGMWQLPGGGVNFGERVEEAVRREVKEEVGLDVEVLSIVSYIINSIIKRWHGIGIVLYCRLNDVKQVIKLNEVRCFTSW